MKILYVSSEAFPFCKTGGLADVAGSLPPALARTGDDVAVLLPLYEKRRSEYVISDKSGFVSPRTYEYRFHRVLDRCGLPSINYHALRHTFDTRCIELGVDDTTLSEILGHEDVSTTQIAYVHSSKARKREQLEKLFVESY